MPKAFDSSLTRTLIGRVPPAARSLPRDLVARPVPGLLFGLTASYALTVGLLALRNRTPDLPRSFIPYLIVLSLPCALTLVAVTRGFKTATRVTQLAWLSAGLLAVWFSTPHVLWPIAALSGVALVHKRVSMLDVGRFALLLVLLVIGYAAVWNFNSVLAPLSVGRLHDPVLITVDQWLLASPTYTGIFPVIESHIVFRLLERGYLFLFAEILTVALWMAVFRPAYAYWWVARLFMAYAIGLVAFLVWPTVGPHIYAPESLRAAWHHTPTFRAMQAMDVDYDRIIAGGRGGMNYFIAFPSLHVAAATICQCAVRQSGALFWLLLPITMLVACSTFLLGYHYALDIPAGVLTAFIAWRSVDWLIRQQPAIVVPAASRI
jgi:hypothetical protein